MHRFSGIHTDTALTMANAEHQVRIARAAARRLTAGSGPVDDAGVGQGSVWGRVFGLVRTVRPALTVVALVALVGSMLVVATPADANPCVTDGEFAAAHSWCVSYETVGVEAAVTASGSERGWVARLDPADRAALVGAETDLFVGGGPLRAL